MFVALKITPFIKWWAMMRKTKSDRRIRQYFRNTVNAIFQKVIGQNNGHRKSYECNLLWSFCWRRDKPEVTLGYFLSNFTANHIQIHAIFGSHQSTTVWFFQVHRQFCAFNTWSKNIYISSFATKSIKWQLLHKWIYLNVCEISDGMKSHTLHQLPDDLELVF